jgi:hypothetical protein
MDGRGIESVGKGMFAGGDQGDCLMYVVNDDYDEEEAEEEESEWWREMFVGLAAWQMRAMRCCRAVVGR